MRKLIAWWATNTVAANLLMVGILLAGILGFIAMEREAFPNFTPNEVSIEVTWLGAAPQEIEEQVVVRIENAIDNIDSVYRYYSFAEENYARIDVSTLPTDDMEGFLNEIKNAVDSVNSLPRDIEKPQVRRVEYRNEMIRVAVHGEVGERALTRLAEELRDEVAALPYISIVELFGTSR
jgi:multidrug efflux pump subunit AcrB